MTRIDECAACRSAAGGICEGCLEENGRLVDQGLGWYDEEYAEFHRVPVLRSVGAMPAPRFPLANSDTIDPVLGTSVEARLGDPTELLAHGRAARRVNDLERASQFFHGIVRQQNVAPEIESSAWLGLAMIAAAERRPQHATKYRDRGAAHADPMHVAYVDAAIDEAWKQTVGF